LNTENPYAPPGSFRGNIGAFARHYRIDMSQTTLREFQNLSGRPIRGTLFWVAMQLGLKQLDKQIIDGPKPFADDQCTLESLQDPVRTHLLRIAEQAEKGGFHARSYAASNSTGIVVHGGAIRMLHRSRTSFLQILASSDGSMLHGYENVISATSDTTTAFASTSGPPNYDPVKEVKTQRFVGAPLDELLDLHSEFISNVKNLVTFDSFDDVGVVMDHLSHLFFADKVERGVFIPEA